MTAPPYFATVGGEDFPIETTFEVVNPATEQVLAHAPCVRADRLDEVFAAATRALPEWQADEGRRRAALRAAADRIDEHAAELSRLLTLEQGKPLAQAAFEFVTAADWLRYYAGLDLDPEVIRDDESGYEAVVRRPLGVVSAITPWNSPITLAMWKIAPALRAGNSIVLKPSPYTPLATLAMARLIRAAFPSGVLNVVTGPEPLGARMIAHPTPRKVTFTGSTTVGIAVARAAAGDLKRVTLELGGNDAAIVLADADVDTIAESLFWSGFRNCGQICLAVKRVYVAEPLRARLTEALAAQARAAVVGDGLDNGVQIGPLNNAPQLERVSGLVDDALRRGGRAVAGGSRPDRPGYFYEPTIVDSVEDGIPLVDEEQFGPAMPIVSFTNESDVVAAVNRSSFGLTSSVWSSDPEHAFRLAAGLDTGQVAVNGHGRGVTRHLPFGGHKLSGIGVENGPWGLDSFTELKVIAGPSRRGTECSPSRAVTR